jgi:hypothetical protein
LFFESLHGLAEVMPEDAQEAFKVEGRPLWTDICREARANRRDRLDALWHELTARRSKGPLYSTLNLAADQMVSAEDRVPLRAGDLAVMLAACGRIAASFDPGAAATPAAIGELDRIIAELETVMAAAVPGPASGATLGEYACARLLVGQRNWIANLPAGLWMVDALCQMRTGPWRRPLKPASSANVAAIYIHGTDGSVATLVVEVLASESALAAGNEFERAYHDPSQAMTVSVDPLFCEAMNTAWSIAKSERREAGVAGRWRVFRGWIPTGERAEPWPDARGDSAGGAALRGWRHAFADQIPDAGVFVLARADRQADLGYGGFNNPKEELLPKIDYLATRGPESFDTVLVSKRHAKAVVTRLARKAGDSRRDEKDGVQVVVPSGRTLEYANPEIDGVSFDDYREPEPR